MVRRSRQRQGRAGSITPSSSSSPSSQWSPPLHPALQPPTCSNSTASSLGVGVVILGLSVGHLGVVEEAAARAGLASDEALGEEDVERLADALGAAGNVGLDVAAGAGGV